LSAIGKFTYGMERGTVVSFILCPQQQITLKNSVSLCPNPPLADFFYVRDVRP